MGKAKFLLLQRRIYNLKMIIRQQKYKINYLKILKNQKNKLSPQTSNKKTDKRGFEKRLNAKACQIIKDFLNNIDLDPHARSYSMESKLFYLGLFERSADAYRWLQKVFPIPSESNLNNTFSLTIKSREFDLLSLDSLNKTIQRVNLNEKVDSVLSVDAFKKNLQMRICSCLIKVYMNSSNQLHIIQLLFLLIIPI